MRAEIDVESSSHPAVLIRLRQKKWLISRWARRFRTRIIAVATTPQSENVLPEGNVVIFKPYATSPNAMSREKPLNSIFGYALPEIDHARTRLSPSGANQFCSPEGNRIAQAQSGTFSFLVNVLGYDWEGAEEVANIMFACTLPKALPEEHVRKRARRLREVLRRKLRRDRKRIEADYLPFVREGISASIARHKDEIALAASQMAEKETERLAMLAEIAEIEEYLAHIELGVKSPGNIEREFEQILRMEGVAALLVETEYSGDGKVPIIVICTKRIFQEFDGKKFDIGSFRIKIDTSKLGKESIRFIQDSRGDYVHPHALPAAEQAGPDFQVCYGTDHATGLNDAVNKLMADFELVPLVHLLLTFLRLDHLKPREAAFKRTGEAEERVKYDSPEDRAKAREAFVETVGKVLLWVHTKKSRVRLEELQRKEGAATKEYYTLRRARSEHNERIKFLSERLRTADPSRNALARLLSSPAVLYARVFEKSFQVWFWNAKTTSIHMLWLDPKRSPWIVGYQKPEGVSVFHAQDGADEKYRRRVLKLIASGKLAEAAESIIGRILSSR